MFNAKKIRLQITHLGGEEGIYIENFEETESRQDIYNNKFTKKL